MSGTPNAFKGSHYLRAPKELDVHPHGWQLFQATDMTDVQQVRKLSQYGIAKTVDCIDCLAARGADCVSANGLKAQPAHSSRQHRGHRHVRELIAHLESEQVASCELVAATVAGLVVAGEVVAIFLLGPHRPLVWPWVRRSTLETALDIASVNAATAASLLDECGRPAARIRVLHGTQDLITRPGNPDPNKPAEVA